MRVIRPPARTESLTLEERFHPTKARGPFYHATNVELEPGDMIQPAAKIGHPGNFAIVLDQQNRHYQPDMAYAHIDPAEARKYAEHYAPCSTIVYLVEPSGPIFEDPENFLWGNKSGTSIISTGWRVITRTNF